MDVEFMLTSHLYGDMCQKVDGLTSWRTSKDQLKPGALVCQQSLDVDMKGKEGLMV